MRAPKREPERALQQYHSVFIEFLRITIISIMEERQPLIERAPYEDDGGVCGIIAAAASPPSETFLTRKGILFTFMIAVVVFVSSAGLSRTVTGGVEANLAVQAPNDTAYLRDKGGEPLSEIPSGSLISPYNGTRPSLTTTFDCAGDLSLPVIAGADVVAYFSMQEGQKPAIARGDIRTTYDGYLFYFNTQENMQTFEDDPKKYIPAWGGFCSYGIANEGRWTGSNLGPFVDPSQWLISPQGRLHLFRSGLPKAKFLHFEAESLEKGSANWDSWFEGQPGPLNTACLCSEAICTDA